jgi:hypothetical protein
VAVVAAYHGVGVDGGGEVLVVFLGEVEGGGAVFDCYS